MFGATTQEGKLVSGISMILYFLVFTLKDVPVEKGILASTVAGIIMILGGGYYQFLRKKLCMLWGVSAWVYGVIFLVFSLFQLYQ